MHNRIFTPYAKYDEDSYEKGEHFQILPTK